MSEYKLLDSGGFCRASSWNLKEELKKADYKIKREKAGCVLCPYCGHNSRHRKYRLKKTFAKCESCGKIRKVHNIGRG